MEIRPAWKNDEESDFRVQELFRAVRTNRSQRGGLLVREADEEPRAR